MMEWQPIKSAPRDRKHLLLREPGEALGYAGHFYFVGFYDESRRTWTYGFPHPFLRYAQPVEWKYMD
jgi:hypothetical protein